MSEFGVAPPRHELPRLALVRNVTDRTVMDCVYAGRRVTRVDVAGLTGISKPTISESVRRLTDSGVLVESGSVSGRRGRAAIFYELAPTAGAVLALQVSQEGIRARCADLAGDTLATWFYTPDPAGTVDGVLSALRTAARDGLAAASGRLRAIAISVANPVDPATDAIVALPHTPFPEGLIDPIGLFVDLTDAPVLIDNDVNLAARAELAVRPDPDASFGYLYAGAGLGMSLCLGGHIVRGANGLAGEIAYLPNAGRPGRTLLDRFVDLGLVRAGGDTIDVALTLSKLARGTRLAAAIGATLASAAAATCAIVNPAAIIVGGPIGSHPAVLERVRLEVSELTPLPVVIEASSVIEDAPLTGAVDLGLVHAREHLLEATS